VVTLRFSIWAGEGHGHSHFFEQHRSRRHADRLDLDAATDHPGSDPRHRRLHRRLEQLRVQELDARTGCFPSARGCLRERRALCLFTAKPLVSSSKPYSILIRPPPRFVSTGTFRPSWKTSSIVRWRKTYLRYQHASEMRRNLQRLKRDTETGACHLPVRDEWQAYRKRDAGGHNASNFAIGSALLIDTSASTAAAAKLAEIPLSKRQNLWKIAIPSVVLLVGLIASGLYYRSHRAKPLTDKDTVVLADFANITGDRSSTTRSRLR